jgi:hypothetical protein
MRFLPRLGYSVGMAADAATTPTILAMLAGLLRVNDACRHELQSQIESFNGLPLDVLLISVGSVRM